MNIAIDLTALDFTHHNGIRHYSLCLIEALSTVDRVNKYQLLSFQPLHINVAKNFSTIIVKKKYPFFNRELIVASLLNNTPFDVIHCPTTFAPYFLKNKRLILNVHDTHVHGINNNFPQSFLHNNINIMRLQKHIKWSATMVCDSHFVKKEIVNSYRKTGLIQVVSPGISTQFKPLKNMQKKDLIICFADCENRKNIFFSIKVFAKFHKAFPNFQLTIIAAPQQVKILKSAIKERGMSNNVTIVSNLSQKKLISLYQQAFCLLFPSTYEGFGLPLLEAMVCGCPVLTSKKGALQEVGQNACMYLTSFSVDTAVKVMTRLKENKKLYTTMQERGIKRAALFSWKKTAYNFLRIYNLIGKQTTI